MKPTLPFAGLLALTLAWSAFAADSDNPAKLTVVASFPNKQVTGIAVSKKSGRIFVNFPDWLPGHTISVAEVMKDGALKPYPNARWNADEGDPHKRFVCVQSVHIDDDDMLWILDPAAPKLDNVVRGGPKLVEVDLSTNKVVKNIAFDDKIAPQRSYLNDVRIDTKNNYAFITESGVGSLIVVNLADDKARRVLADSPTTKLEVGKPTVVDGLTLIDPKTGTGPNFNADGLALDQKNGIVYYHDLAGFALYKISVANVINPNLTDKELGEKVVKVAETPAPDGMLCDKEGRVYLAAIEKDAIVRVDPTTGKSETIVEDKRLQWPDSMSWGPDDQLYVTTSQIHHMPQYNGGKSTRKEPYHIFRLSVPE